MELNMLMYVALALIFALVGGKIIKQFNLPNVTGYLLIGLLVGPSCLNLLPENILGQWGILTELALGFIAFSIGAEFKMNYLKKVGKAPVIIAIFEGVMAIIFVDAALILIGCDIAFALCLGAIASATAPAATLMVVKQYKAKGPVTSTLLPVVAIDDAVALIGFGVSVAVAKAINSTGNVNMVKTILEPAYEIFGALVLGVLLGIIFRLLVKLYTGRGNRLAVTIALVAVCVGLADMLGFSSLLACMMMSAVLVNTSNVSDMIFSQTDRMTPPLYMLFFLIAGAELELSVIPTVGIIGAVYIVVRVIGKVFGAWLGAIIGKSEPVVKKYIGLTLVPQAGVAIGLATVAMSVVPEYGTQIRAIILCGTIVYEIIGPVLTKTTLKKAGEIVEN